jgi:molybdenum cofactor synthesis domain-containing protein
MIQIAEAIQIIEREIKPLGGETVRLSDAVGHVLSKDIQADTDMPPFDRSQMDGFAVIAEDTAETPATLKIVGESAAGRGWHSRLERGEAVRIMTGAPVPDGADAVQQLENASEDGDSVVIEKEVKQGRSIVRKGDEMRKGQTVFPAGEAVTPNMIAALAAFGYSEVPVSKRPKLAVLPTGSEIVEITETPGTDQIRNSNAAMLKALAQHAGAAATDLPIARDDLENLKSRIRQAASECNILVITGGVSVGKYDLTKDALRGLGAEMFFERLSLKPGKPTVFARLNETFVFGLPGNPVSAAVTFYLFVRHAIMLMQRADRTGLRRGTAVLTRSGKGVKGRDSYLPASLRTGRGQLFAEPLKWGGSSDFVGFSRAEALVVVPADENFDEGDTVEILFL